MKKILLWLMALGLLFCTAAAEPLSLDGELQGVYCFPEGIDEQQAAYVYSYAYPRVAGDDDVSLMINEFYAYLVSDAMGFAGPMAAEEAAVLGISGTTEIAGEVTCNSDAFFSVKVTTETYMGAGASHVVAGHVFARQGEKAGMVVNLPYLLGLVDADETDEWLLERQTAKADAMVRALVWDILQEQIAEGSIAFYDDLSEEMLEYEFYPEEDFYLDANGDPVFFLQEGAVAPVTEGVMYFPFTLDELLDEI